MADIGYDPGQNPGPGGGPVTVDITDAAGYEGSVTPGSGSTGGAAGEADSGIVGAIKSFFGIESGSASRVGGEIVGQIQAADIIIDNFFRFMVGADPQGHEQRERFQGENARNPEYDATERAIYDEAERRIENDPSLTPREAQKLTNDLFLGARRMVEEGASLRDVRQSLKDPTNPFVGPDLPFAPETPMHGGRGWIYGPPVDDPSEADPLDRGGFVIDPFTRTPYWPGTDPNPPDHFLQEPARPGNLPTPPRGHQRIDLPSGYTLAPYRGGVYVVGPDGQAANLSRVTRNLAANIRAGLPLSATQQVLVDAMTPEQRRAAGIFTRPDGSIASGQQIVEGAFRNLSAGAPLSANQQAALGMFFNGIRTPGARRDAVTALARAAGIPVQQASQVVGQSMRAAGANQQAARQQAAQAVTSPSAAHAATRRQILDVIGRDTTFTTRGGKVVSARHVVENALQNQAAGRPLTENQKRVMAQYRQAGGAYASPSERGRPTVRARPGAPAPYAPRQQTFTTKTGQTRTVQQVLRNAAANQAAGRPLTANQKKAVKQAAAEQKTQQIRAQAQPKPKPAPKPAPRPAPAPPRQAPPPAQRQQVFKTATGRTRTRQEVLANARQNIAAGRPLTANQKKAVKQTPASSPAGRQLQAAARAAPRVVPQPRPRVVASATPTTPRVSAYAPRPAPAPAPRPAAPALRPAPPPRPAAPVARPSPYAGRPTPAPRPAPRPAPAPTYTTRTGQTRTQAQVLRNAAQNQAAGRPLTANQKKALKAQKKAKKK